MNDQPTVRVAVQTVPNRLPVAGDLADLLSGAADGLVVRAVGLAIDHHHPQHPNALRGLRNALELYAHPYEPLLTIQDDAIPAPGLIESAARASRRFPRDLVAFYVGSIHSARHTYLRDVKRGRSYSLLPIRRFVPTVCLLWPAGAPQRFLKASQDWEIPQDDEAVMRWLLTEHKDRQARRSAPRAWAAIPSLCRHDNTLPSTLDHHHHGARDALLPWDEAIA